jgi:TorA maturation chaperone TorD
MSFLTAREAYALQSSALEPAQDAHRDVQRKFLREHLGRWSPAFARRLERAAEGTALAAIARFLGTFLSQECARVGIPPGSGDLLLRPVDDRVERLCDACGIPGLESGSDASHTP